MSNPDMSELRRMESILTDLIADTGDLNEIQQPICARNQLLGLLQSVQAMIADNE